MQMNFDRVTVPSTEIFRRSSYTGRIPISTAITRSGAGGTTLPTRVIPLAAAASAPATASAFGVAPRYTGVIPVQTAIAPTSISRIGSSFTNAGVGIMNTFGTLVPLAIKVIGALIVIKIVLWLLKKRR